MLPSTIDSWRFFLQDASGDYVYLLSQALGSNSYSPDALLNIIFNREFKGIEVSYDGYLHEHCRRQNREFRSSSIESMEDLILIDIINTAIKRCPEDEKDLLLNLLGIGDDVEKKAFTEVLSKRALSMDKFLLPGIALLLFLPISSISHFFTLPFRLDRNQDNTFGQIRRHTSVPDSDRAAVVLIGARRSYSYNGVNSKTEGQEIGKELISDGIVNIPEDIFTVIPKTYEPFIGITIREEFVDDRERFQEFIHYLIQLSGHVSKENAETLLRILTGYPFPVKQKKLLWDGRQFRSLLYVIKFMYKPKEGKGLRYSIILENSEFEPAVDSYEWKQIVELHKDFSNSIGNGIGKRISRLVLQRLYDLYPTVYTNPNSPVREKREKQ